MGLRRTAVLALAVLVLVVPGLAWGLGLVQDPLPPDGPPLALGQLWTLAIGAVGSGIYGVLKGAFAFLRALPPWAKGLVFIASQFLVSFVSKFFNLPLPEDLTTWTAATISAIAAAAGGMGLRALLKAIRPTPAPA